MEAQRTERGFIMTIRDEEAGREPIWHIPLDITGA